MNEPDPMEETGIAPRDPRKCTATTARTALPKVFDAGYDRLSSDRARVSSSEGQGGGAVELAELRLRGLAPRAVAELENLVHQRQQRSGSPWGRNSLVDRGGVGKATERIQVAAAITVKRPW